MSMEEITWHRNGRCNLRRMPPAFTATLLDDIIGRQPRTRVCFPVDCLLWGLRTGAKVDRKTCRGHFREDDNRSAHGTSVGDCMMAGGADSVSEGYI